MPGTEELTSCEVDGGQFRGGSNSTRDISDSPSAESRVGLISRLEMKSGIPSTHYLHSLKGLVSRLKMQLGTTIIHILLQSQVGARSADLQGQGLQSLTF